MTSQKPRSLWRAVLAVASVTALLACSLSPGARSASADTARKLRAGPFLGAPAAGTQPIWLCVEAAVERIEVAFAPDTQGATPNRVPAIPVEGGPGSFVATLTGLSPNTGYRYDVLIGGEKVPKGSGAFRTPPAAGTPFQGRIAVVSCSDVKRDAKQPAFKALAKEEPGLLLHLGDNVYANTPRRARQAALHIQQRRVKTYRDLVRATPVAAIWDDHDYGKNDGNGTLKGKQESLAVFREMFPNPGYQPSVAEGVFSKLQYGDVDLFLLDTRYHRAPNFSLSRGKAMLGEAQMKWLEEQLAASTATFKVIASGSTLRISPKDGWILYPRARKRLYRAIGKTPGVLFVTGDLHRSFIDAHPALPGGNLTYRLTEAVSSGVALGRDDSMYTTLDFDTLAEDPAVTISIVHVDRSGKVTRRDDTRLLRSKLEPPK